MNLQNTNSTHFVGKYGISRIGILLCMTFLVIPFLNSAQTDPLPTRYETVNMPRLEAKSISAKSSTEIVSQTISEPGATWLRVFFKDVNPGKNSTLTIVSELDGASQTLTSATIKDWKNTSAYFNGDIWRANCWRFY